MEKLSRDRLKNRYLKPVILLLIGILFFSFFLLIIGIDFNVIYKNLLEINLYYLPLIICVDILFILSYALAWFFLVKIVCPEIKLGKAMLIVIAGWFGDMLIPAAFMTGEALRLILLKKIYKLDMSKAAATVVIHRLLNALAFLFLMLMGIAMLAFYGETKVEILHHSVTIILLSILGLAIAFFVLRKIRILRKVLKVIVRYLSAVFKTKKLDVESKIDSIFTSFENSLNIITKNKTRVLIGFIILLFQWFLGVTIPYLFFLSVGYRVNFWILSVAYPIYSLMDNIPIGIPANAGVLDIAMISTFVVLGIPKEIATLVTILTRSIIVIFEAILTGSISVIFLSRTFAHFSIRDLRKIVED